MVADGEVVLIDIGHDHARLARLLARQRITVITSSLAVVDELRDDRPVEAAGTRRASMRRNYRSLVRHAHRCRR